MNLQPQKYAQVSLIIRRGGPRLLPGTWVSNWFEVFRTHSVHAVPLFSGNRALGMLSVLVEGEHRFTEREKAVLQTFADQAVIAIQNARLLKQPHEGTEQVEVVSERKAEFMANMSHELRTHLSAIIGYAELLQEECKDVGHGAHIPDLSRIHTSAHHLLELINEILDSDNSGRSPHVS